MVLYLTSKICIYKSPNTWGQVAYICKENICDAFLSPQKHLYDTSQVLFMCNVPFVPCPDYVTSINQGRLKKELQLPLYLGQGRTMLAQMQRRKFVCLLSKFIFNSNLKIEEENSQKFLELWRFKNSLILILSHRLDQFSQFLFRSASESDTNSSPQSCASADF